jgi:hypothetical protein
MTVKEVYEWCRANRVDARGFVRGAEFSLSGGDRGSPASHSLGDVLHWEVTVINGQSYPCSPSDMQRLVAGKISLENFVQVMSRAERRGGE